MPIDYAGSFLPTKCIEQRLVNCPRPSRVFFRKMHRADLANVHNEKKWCRYTETNCRYSNIYGTMKVYYIVTVTLYKQLYICSNEILRFASIAS
jgi:hypothetical protein